MQEEPGGGVSLGDVTARGSRTVVRCASLQLDPNPD